jgi:hypothetical protein
MLNRVKHAMLNPPLHSAIQACRRLLRAVCYALLVLWAVVFGGLSLIAGVSVLLFGPPPCPPDAYVHWFGC